MRGPPGVEDPAAVRCIDGHLFSEIYCRSARWEVAQLIPVDPDGEALHTRAKLDDELDVEEVSLDAWRKRLSSPERPRIPGLSILPEVLDLSHRQAAEPNPFRKPTERELDREGHLLVERHVRIPSVPHPGDLDPPSVGYGDVTPGLGGVPVEAHLRRERVPLRGKMLPVERTQKVPARGAPEDPRALPWIPIYRQLEEVWAFGRTANRHGIQTFPGAEVGGAEERIVVSVQVERHDPCVGGLMPEDSGVSVGALDVGQDGVPGVLCPAAAPVPAIGDALHARFAGVRSGIDARVAGYQGRLLARPEAGGVVPVHNRRSGPDAAQAIVRLERVVDLLPVHEVLADRVSPAHRAPGDAGSMPLKEQVVFPLVEHQAIGIVDPVLSRREVELGPKQLGVSRVPAHSFLPFQ